MKPIIHHWGPVTCYQGHVIHSLETMPRQSIHVAVTSPPYWNLRSYLPNSDPLKQFELGREPTPELFIENLVKVFAAVHPVLRDDGILAVNLGDTYGDDSKWGGSTGGKHVEGLHGDSGIGRERTACGLPGGSQLLIPHRFAIAMQAAGWILRDTVIWRKPCPMPASIDGVRWERCRKKGKSLRDVGKGYAGNSHEKIHNGLNGHSGSEIVPSTEWIDCPGCKKCDGNNGYVLRRGSWRTTTAHEYIFLFAKQMGYFCDAHAVREEAAIATLERNKYSRIMDDPDEQFAAKHDHEFSGTTRNPRSVRDASADPHVGELLRWLEANHPDVAAELHAPVHNAAGVQTWSGDNYEGKHYAVFPRELAEFFIRAGTSAKGCCSTCGAPIARVVSREVRFAGGSGRAGVSPGGKCSDTTQAGTGTYDVRMGAVVKAETKAWKPSCGCANARPVPCRVLDPFGGSGTTALVAISLGCEAMLCELFGGYVAQQQARLQGALPLFTAA